MTDKRREGQGAPWRRIVASALDWEQAHIGLERALEDLPAELRGRRPEGTPYSIWQLVEHIRIAQHDLLDFCTNSDYEHDLAWPDDYWPDAPEPPSDEAWEASLGKLRAERAELARWAVEADLDLTSEIPWGDGQTFLRSVLVAADHAAYHVGQIVLLRKQLEGGW